VAWKTPVTLLVLLGVLFGAAFYGWTTIVSDGSPGKTVTTPTATCKTTKVTKRGHRLRARNVVVNVYNAGSVNGLAGRTLVTLKARGFRSGVALNAPAGVFARNVRILTARPRSPQAQLVARQFRGKPHFGRARAMAPGVDVVVGDFFAGFRKKKTRSIVIRTSIRTCASIQTPASP
jgi:hypothetical protein